MRYIVDVCSVNMIDLLAPRSNLRSKFHIERGYHPALHRYMSPAGCGKVLDGVRKEAALPVSHWKCFEIFLQ